MSESLVGRVARLVSGTFTSMVDLAENSAPDIVAREAISEIDRAIDDIRTEIGRKQASRHNANNELTQLNNRAEELQAQIQTALSESREDLALSGTRELVGMEDRIPIIEGLITTTQEEEDELNQYLAGLRSKRDEMEKDLQAIKDVASFEKSGVEPSINAEQSAEARVEKASNAISRVKASVTGAPSEKKAMEAKSKAELEELHLKNRVSERLAALQKGS